MTSTSVSNSKLPFLWGAATSSHQIEGGNEANDWWTWEALGKIDGGVRSGAASAHREHFRADLRLAREMRLGSYRFSFEWSRFEPTPGDWKSEAVDWYHELLNECEALELVPMATLHHFTSPQWFAESGGFVSDRSVAHFARFAEKIRDEFGARIPLWCTLNEPMVLTAGGYLARFMPPGIYDPAKAALVCKHLVHCHVRAYDLLRQSLTRTGAFRHRPLEIGFAHNMIDFLPHRNWHLADQILSRMASSVYNEAWLRACHGDSERFACPAYLPFVPRLEVPRQRRTFDFVGVNYYTKAYLQWRPKIRNAEVDAQVPVGLSFARRKETASDLGWAVHPNGLRRMLDLVRPYKVPIYITENGIADQSDQLRGDYLLSHLAVLAEAIQSGLDIRGYYHWSLIDNFEWIKGFWPRFGLAEVNYDSQKRTPRPSARLYSDLIQAHQHVLSPTLSILQEFRSVPPR